MSDRNITKEQMNDYINGFYLSLEEIRNLTGWSISDLNYKMTKHLSSRLPFVKIGRMKFIHIHNLIKHIDMLLESDIPRYKDKAQEIVIKNKKARENLINFAKTLDKS